MSAQWKSVMKAVTPRALRVAVRSAFGWRWFEGDYATWAEAQGACTGYDAGGIVEQVLEATLAVRAGRAVFERDGMLFHEPTLEPGLVAALDTVASAQGDRLRVLDFGGALGTTYWRHRAELADFVDLTWDIIEQQRFVAVGRACFADSSLRFFENVDAGEAACRHDLLLASTSLQYLESPHAVLDDWVERGFPWLLFNNLPLHPAGPDRLTVQRVPPKIYPASYPVWFFNRERFVAHFTASYEIVSEFAAEAVWPVGLGEYPSTGLLLRRRKGAR